MDDYNAISNEMLVLDEQPICIIVRDVALTHIDPYDDQFRFD